MPMSKRLWPRLDILPKAQLTLWHELRDVPETFILYGGTALALHLGHRQSEDFDFFADHPIDANSLLETIPFLVGAVVIQLAPDTLTCLVSRGDPVRVSFFGLSRLNRLRAPHVAAENGLKVADLLDIAGTKVAVVQRRAQRKDYIDIDALIRAGIPLERQLAAAKLIYGSTFTPTPSLKALTFFDDGDLALLPKDVRMRLTQAAAAVDPLRLPRLARKTRKTDSERDR